MTYPVPTKPGFYWAKEASYNGWVIVRVDELADTLAVLVWGLTDPRPIWVFTFGPEVVKPEGLE